MSHQHTCANCKTPFESPKKHQKYCSQHCYATRFGDVTKECVICHTPFTVAYRFREKQTCSDACHSRNMSQKMSSDTVTVTCPGCNQPFESKLRGVYHVDVGDLSPEKIISYVEEVSAHIKNTSGNPIPVRSATTYCSLDCFYRHKYGKESDVVTLTCEGCGEQFERPFIRRNARFCSKSCSVTGERNSQFGLGKEQARNKVPRWHAGKTAKDDPRLAALGEKMSVIIADKIVNGEWNHQPGYKGEHFFSKKNNKEFYLRSSYESKYARILEEDEDVVSYEHEPFRIPYMLDGAMHNYIPDFFVTRLRCKKQLVEVKPKMLVGGANLVKFHAARAWCQLNDVDYCIVTEAEIESSQVRHHVII